MRLAHHLLRHPSGMWHFRLVVPKALRPLVGLGVIKRSLHTKNTTMARLWAYALGAQYAQVFANAMEHGGKESAEIRWKHDLTKNLFFCWHGLSLLDCLRNTTDEAVFVFHFATATAAGAG
ncbi:DUF6538 domain-containing protein [Dyella sp.]|uniref:DUF6538 domain-containing protein n=1 Tax=Dyella sp. TaxID=1869338 RepID=UPI0039C88DF3